jgi:tRNA(adenine34) deaminase
VLQDLRARDDLDRRLMARCIELSRAGAAAGELPFGSVVAREPELIAESANCTNREFDLSRHAEIVALAQARKAVGDQNLRDCTIYSTVEPCVMCSYCIREAGVRRVVFALTSPIMGGLSGWNILGEDKLSDRIPFVFRSPPDVATGVLADEAASVWREWNPLHGASSGLADSCSYRGRSRKQLNEARTACGTLSGYCWVQVVERCAVRWFPSLND